VANVLYEGLPNAEMVILPQSGHFGNLEEAEAFARAIGDFVR